MSDKVIRAIASVVPMTGADYLRRVTQALAATGTISLAFIAEMPPDSDRWRVVATSALGEAKEALVGEPLDREALRDRAQKLAGDHILTLEEAQLPTGEVCGLVGVIHPQPLSTVHAALLTIVAIRAATEIARARTELVGISKAQALQATLLGISRMPGGAWQARLQMLLESTARALGVERVGYWTLTPESDAIVCAELFVLSPRRFERGARLEAKDYPQYFAALLADEPVVADDARTDPRTREFTVGYFDVHGITSMLDVPVFCDGRLVGVLCHEHVGSPRHWTIEDEGFSLAIGRTIASALESDARARAEERYRLVANAVGEVVWDLDLETHRIDWSAVDHLFGHSLEQGQDFAWWANNVHPADRPRVERGLEAALAGSQTQWADEYRFRRGDGSLAIVRDRGGIMRRPDGRPYRMIGSMLDITETKALEQRLVLAERMASMGTLAAGVAHEINNPLAYVKGNIEHVLEELRKHPGIDRDLVVALEDARHGAERLRAIVQDLRMFSRPRDGETAPVDVEHVIESSLSIARNAVKHRARVEKNFGHPPLVAANESRLGQVVLNLIVNALQSMPEDTTESNVLRLESGIDASGRVFIEVADTGSGISTEDLARIFDPFFTTKPVGEGTGLGLAIANSIVLSLGGQLLVDSALERGTTFRVFLPAANATTPVAATPPPAKTRRGRVLVVDDDPLVAGIVRRSLARAHDVETVVGGRQALERLESSPEFDLVICDLMMPDLNGAEVFDRAIRVRPDLRRRFLFMTGGAFTPEAQAFLDATKVPLIDKPFTPAELRRRVAEFIT